MYRIISFTQQNKEEQMNAQEIKKNIYWVGVKDWNLREFHGYATPHGSTYNSYLIMDDKIALIDGVKAYLSHEQIARIQSQTDLSRLAYIIVNHVEMDHSGNLPELMKLAPQAKIVTSAAGKMALEAHFDTIGWEYEIIKTGDSLPLGQHTLEFMTTPMLHWPDSMMTYVKEDKILFSNDGFGQHYAAASIWAKDVSLGIICQEAKSYYANILFPFGTQAEKALNTAHQLELDIDMIAPSHGCIWDGKEEVGRILSLYAKWASGKNEGKAVIVYDTMWGATARLAETAMAVLQDAGIEVVKHCLSNKHISEIMGDLLDAKYVLIGTPTLNNQLFPRVAAFVTYMRGLQPKNKRAMAFASYGWKSGVTAEIQKVYEELGWQTVAPFEQKYTPKSDILEQMAARVRELITE